MQTNKHKMFEILESPTVPTVAEQPIGKSPEVIEFSRPDVDLPLWYDSVADIAQLESISLCVNG